MPSSKRVTVKGRTADRGVYDRAAIDAILDEALVCHVGFVHDGQSVVVPMSHARCGDVLYFHGAPSSRTMRVLVSGAPVCIEVTLLDGIVLGALPGSHGVNYRSVVVFGSGREVANSREKIVALNAIMDHHIPGRRADLPELTDCDVGSTAVAAVSIDEASAKKRSGPPATVGENADTAVWTGVLPLRLSALDPVPLPDRHDEDVPIPAYLMSYGRRGSGTG